MTDIREWLEDLGLVQYVDTFEHNEMDIDLVRDLGDEALEKLGVSVMGHRVKMLRAIAALPARDSESFRATDVREETAAANKPPASEAERRQLTVMFCDLVGSTALSERLDPEELRELMQAYRKACADVIGRYDGHVAQYLGDGVMVYFGWPIAHEDDAGRAVRAGLDIVDAIAGLEAPERLEVRIGVATGLVVVGESGADEGTDSKLAVGDTPNIAARTQGLAAPGTVAIAQSTRRLLGGAFALDDLGTHDAKGVSGGLHVHRVLRAAETESRFEASHDAVLTPLVGRASELSLVMERWCQASKGEGQAVLLSGEPGIGKSRITQALRERLADEPHVVLNLQCSPFYANAAFYPVADQMARAARFARDDSVEARLDKLEAYVVSMALGATEVVPLFAATLSIPTGDRYPPLDITPQKQKDRTIEALAELVIAASRERPVLFIAEDLHWIDPTTLEALGAVIEAVRKARVLIIGTYRPEFDPPWGGHGHVTILTLNRLGRSQAAEMVAKVTGGKAMPDEVLDQITAKTDGVPLFVEELTKTVLEAGLMKAEGDAYVLDGPLPPLAIPSTLRDSLMARLDRLATVKEVAQTGACIGREFGYDLLAAVSPLADNELQEALWELVTSELVFQHGTAPDATYTFKHALVQDAAYESLLKSKRSQVHASLAEKIEERFPDTVANEPELLAHHYTSAGLAMNAIDYWLKAGMRTTERSAYVEALSHLRAGLGLLPELPDSAERDEMELDLQIAVGVALIATRGYAAPETGHAYERARELCTKLGDPPQISRVFYGLWVHYINTRTFFEARDLAKDFVAAAERADQRVPLVVAERMFGQTLMQMGDNARALEHLDRAIDLYDQDQDRALVTTYALDPRALAIMVRSLCLWPLGYPEQASRASNQAIDWAEEIHSPYTLAYVLCFGRFIEYFLREPDAALRQTDWCKALCDEHGYSVEILSLAKCLRGWALVCHGDSDNGLPVAIAGLNEYSAADALTFQPASLTVVADACITAGKPEQGLEFLARSLSVAENIGDAFWKSECHRIRGELLLQSSDDNQAEADFAYRRAIEAAQSQEAKSWELRAATSRARLWQSQGKRYEAHDLLGGIYGWFTEGFDTADLKDAKALLDELK